MGINSHEILTLGDILPKLLHKKQTKNYLKKPKNIVKLSNIIPMSGLVGKPLTNIIGGGVEPQKTCMGT